MEVRRRQLDLGIGQQPYKSGRRILGPFRERPGGRSGSVSWIDASGNFWLFGGYGIDSTGSLGAPYYFFLNDLWKFDGTNWTWVSGSNTRNQTGVYGNKGTADSGNVPGGLSNSVSWIDASGNFWLFGGSGPNPAGNVLASVSNDLWKFDGANWTWVSGTYLDNTAAAYGTYGTKGTADPANVPGTRNSSVSWIDASGNLWIFGGSGLDSSGTSGIGSLNDLWRYTR